MLVEWLSAVAAAGGTAVVQAADTDMWVSVRQRVAHVLGHDDPGRERTELMRLDLTATDLASLAPGEAALIRARQEASWTARFEMLLESLGEAERERVACELNDIADQARHASVGGVPRNVFRGPSSTA
ncbi:hypothetical protein [Microbispora bryophytorum]|uniref:Uncharacterized protein n=1 Tax=Microbispora bryophytorum TaxID=1460882 RepID=A0A8H9GWV7_9ACTN|nr:hypothetical protein [Microbispora bryophytorum]MBD3136301.1 hypothetical protein [Microbispora bryophytorum]TQS08024.1 hypothetical protein FLX07_09550 [Microbispora bryophytorum]GGO05569.1 hypothetical protein GCM10011574_17470 [Microbispora bryophytorum]